MVVNKILRFSLLIFYAGNMFLALKGKANFLGMQGILLAAVFGVMALLFLTRFYFLAAAASAVYLGAIVWGSISTGILGKIGELSLFIVSIATLLPEEGTLSPKEIVAKYRDLIKGKRKNKIGK